MRTAAGDVGWLVTRYADVKALCADYRIGRSHPDPPAAPRLWEAALFSPANNYETELADHRQWRRVLAKGFGASRVDGLRSGMQIIVDQLLDDVLDTGPPADLCARVARPFAADVVFDIVGIPVEDRQQFVMWSNGMRSRQSRAAVRAVRAEMKNYLSRLLDCKKNLPSEDVMSDLANARDRAGRPLQGELVDAAISSFFADFETVAARIAYGTLFLLAHPAQLAALRDDPSLVSSAVEEIMRLAVPGGSWLPRYALADIEYAGAKISAGDLVVFTVQAANRDEEAFCDPATFDISRRPNPHLGFGHGKFFCLGANLTRAMLQTIFATLFQRLPGLRLDVPLEDLEIDSESVTGGLRRLPVTWSRPS
jgi:pentalenolactone synthase